MAVELIHAKLNRGNDMAGDAAYMMDFIFGSPFTNAKGKHIGKAKTIHMGFKNGMPPEDFIIGLRNLADHIQATIIDTKEFDDKPDLKVVDNNSG